VARSKEKKNPGTEKTTELWDVGGRWGGNSHVVIKDLLSCQKSKGGGGKRPPRLPNSKEGQRGGGGSSFKLKRGSGSITQVQIGDTSRGDLEKTLNWKRAYSGEPILGIIEALTYRDPIQFHQRKGGARMHRGGVGDPAFLAGDDE